MKPEAHSIMSVHEKVFTAKDIQHYLQDGEQIIGDLNREFSNIADTENIRELSLDWVHQNNSAPGEYIKSSRAGIVIAQLHLLNNTDVYTEKKTLVLAYNPMLLFSRIARDLFIERLKPGIHPSSVVHPNAKIGRDVYIGPLCYIGNCVIGDYCTIHSHVSIEENVTIGNDAHIKNGARIGQTGFGFVKNENGEYERFPQLGMVVIEDNVEIGSNTCIDRGSLSTTRIGRGTKIDNFVHVAHNVQIGENCILTGHVSIGGSSVIDDDVWIGPSASVRDGVRIGSGAFINMGAVVIRNVKSLDNVIGYPAEDKEQFVAKKRALNELYRERRHK